MRGELQSVQRELQMVQDEAKAAVNSRERLSQELQTKQAQVCSLEGQLDVARTLNNKLSQEVKRLESEEISGNYKFVLFEPIVYFQFLINRVTNHCQYTMLIPQFSFISLPIFYLPLRLEAELEKLQNSICSTDTTPFSTPCWSAASPWEYNGTVL